MKKVITAVCSTCGGKTEFNNKSVVNLRCNQCMHTAVYFDRKVKLTCADLDCDQNVTVQPGDIIDAIHQKGHNLVHLLIIGGTKIDLDAGVEVQETQIDEPESEEVEEMEEIEGVEEKKTLKKKRIKT